jgi:hypothetical protein
MRITLTLIVLFFTICSFGQSSSNGIIKNDISSKHVNVKGTKISVIPPDGWIAATNFNGFQKNELCSSLMVIEFPGPYSEVTKGFTEEGLKSKGIILSEKKSMMVNGFSGTYIFAKQSAYGRMFGKYILVFGDEKKSILINGMCPIDLISKIGKEIEKSVFSVVYEAEKKVNPLENINYGIDVSGSKLKFAKVISNTIAYTVDGLLPTRVNDKTTLIVGSSMGKVVLRDKKEYSINRMKKTPSVNEVDTKNVHPVTIDGLSGFEVIAYGENKKNKKPELVFQIMLFTDNMYYLMIGTANENFEENLKIFRSLSKTFKRK